MRICSRMFLQNGTLRERYEAGDLRRIDDVIAKHASITRYKCIGYMLWDPIGCRYNSIPQTRHASCEPLVTLHYQA